MSEILVGLAGFLSGVLVVGFYVTLSRKQMEARAKEAAEDHKAWCHQQARTYLRLHKNPEQALFDENHMIEYVSNRNAYIRRLSAKWQDVLDAMPAARLQIEQEKIESGL